ncbi:MAG: hypothetical protein Q7R42_06010 [Candidatus Planktophila sp.]|nr:hypothetical protein [Candidatus Planktophila sp.]
MSAGQTSKNISKLILKKLSDAGVPQYQAARWSGISASILSRRLSGENDWLISELSVFSGEVLGMKVSTLLEEAESANCQ